MEAVRNRIGFEQPFVLFLILHRSLYLRMQKAVLYIYFLLCVLHLGAQSLPAGCRYATAFAEQNLAKWKTQLEKHEVNRTSGDALKQQAFGYYGAVAWYIRYEEDSAKMYTDSLGICLQLMEEHAELHAEYSSLKVSLAFFKSYLYPWLSPFYGPYGYLSLNSADSLTKSKPYYWTEMGNSKYHVPDFLGRDYVHSAEYYERSIALFEADYSSLECNWYYLNTLLWLGRSYQKGKKVYRAMEVYHKIVDLRPDFDTVRQIIKLLELDSTARF